MLWCQPGPSGAYRAGLSFDDDRILRSFQPSSSARASGHAGTIDYYDVMELGQNANPETIHRVYRILAKRYHPDNTETGDEHQFRCLLEAYRILSDPELRAGYDVDWQANQHARWKIFDQPQAARGLEGEKRKRQGILSLLYTKRVAQPDQPTLTIHELEDLLGCAREHLEFSLWYLKESALIIRSDNGRFGISLKGVEHAEAAFGTMNPTRTPALLEPPEQAQNSEQHYGGG